MKGSQAAKTEKGFFLGKLPWSTIAIQSIAYLLIQSVVYKLSKQFWTTWSKGYDAASKLHTISPKQSFEQH